MDETTDVEDELPAGWEARVTTDGRVYYAKYYFHFYFPSIEMNLI